MPPADHAAWVQAFASLGAIIVALIAVGVSVWSVIRQGTAARRRDQLRARCLAVSLIPSLYEIEAAVDHAADIINRHLEWHLASKDEEIAGVIREAAIGIPVSLAGNVGELWRLGDVAGPTALQLVGVAEQHNDSIDALAERVAAGKVANVLEAVPYLDERLNLLRRIVEKGKAEIGSIHDALAG